MNAETLKGRAVVSIADSTIVGHVDDLLFDPQHPRLAALHLAAAGQAAVVPFATVHRIGPDAVTIPSADVVHWATPTSSLAGLLRLGELVKLKVVDEAGTFLGTVKSVALDPEDGAISEVQAHQGAC